jgi:hypothetical protein
MLSVEKGSRDYDTIIISYEREESSMHGTVRTGLAMEMNETKKKSGGRE